MDQRFQRVNQLVKEELSQIINKEQFFTTNILVTITRVETSPNLIQSKVWVSVIPEERRTEILNILNRNIYKLQQKLNKRLNMRPVPRIKFLNETKTKEAAKIDELLRKIESEE